MTGEDRTHHGEASLGEAQSSHPAVDPEMLYDDAGGQSVAGRAVVRRARFLHHDVPRVQAQRDRTMGRLRAVEHGRAVLVAATSGVSAVIAPDGRIVDRSKVFARDVLVERVPLRSASTLATRLGVLPELLVSAIAALALGAAVVRR